MVEKVDKANRTIGNLAMQDLDFSTKTALVMGASQGIGEACSKVLAGYGAKVVLAARSLNKLDVIAEEIRTNGGTAHAVECDVTDADMVKEAVDTTIERFGGIDFLINNAGTIDPISVLAESDIEAWSKAIDVNIKGVYYAMRKTLAPMLEQRSGVIVNVSSGAANSSLVGWSHYCAGKAAVQKLTEVAHKELLNTGVRVVGFSPGTVATPMMKKIQQSQINPVSQLNWSRHIPPEWAAEGIAFLCGDGGIEFAGTDFSIKTEEGRQKVGLPLDKLPPK